VPENFLLLYDANRLKHIPRYLQAIAVRSRRAADDPEKDAEKEKIIRPYDEKIRNIAHSLPVNAGEEKRKAVEELYWMVEEFRISLFAQELKTAMPVSKKRLDEKLAALDQIF